VVDTRDGAAGIADWRWAHGQTETTRPRVEDRAGAGDVVQAVSRPAEGLWSPPVTISGKPTGGFLPQVAIDSSGDAVAAWEGASGVGAANRPAAGPWNPPLTISGGNVPIANNSPVRVAVDDNGDAVAVWTESNSSKPTVEASDFRR